MKNMFILANVMCFGRMIKTVSHCDKILEIKSTRYGKFSQHSDNLISIRLTGINLKILRDFARYIYGYTAMIFVRLRILVFDIDFNSIISSP